MRHVTCFFGETDEFMKSTAEKHQKRPVQRGRVLVVDDDVELLLLFQGLLEAHDYEACLAQNGSQALEVMTNCQVDAILCDLQMPKLSGDVFYWAVGCGRPQLLKRFIFVTGHAENPTYEAFLKGTQATVLYKPFPIARLMEKLQAALGIEPQSATQN